MLVCVFHLRKVDDWVLLLCKILEWFVKHVHIVELALLFYKYSIWLNFCWTFVQDRGLL